VNLSFGGRGEVHFRVDPAEYRGMSVHQVAAELHGLAMAKQNLEYASEDFIMAAEQVLAAEQGGK
jgi:hypothetical protein